MIFDVNAWLGVWPFRSLRDNTPDSLTARLDRSGIAVAAVSQIEAIFHRNAQPANERLAEAVRRYSGRLVPMATINPTYPAWEDDLQECHERLAMKGVRLFPQYHYYEIDGPEGRRVAEACAERGLVLSVPFRMEDIRERHWLDPGKTVDLARIANLVAAVPKATVIIPNGRGFVISPLWGREELRERPWYVDLSLTEIHYVLHRDLARKRELADFIEQGGSKHLLFGTHLPFSYAGPALVKRAILPVDGETLEDISYRTAARLFGLDMGNRTPP